MCDGYPYTQVDKNVLCSSFTSQKLMGSKIYSWNISSEWEQWSLVNTQVRYILKESESIKTVLRKLFDTYSNTIPVQNDTIYMQNYI